ncbi:unnamed protein product [Amaranthus hypochondriacus]
MVVYNLEETPEIFIVPHYYDNKFVYRMEHIIGEGNRNEIRSIDLKSDKLMVYGTEIKESSLQRLHDSLIIRQKAGIIHVNCDGACYFLIAGKSSCCRSIHNVIFDWSSFGVIIPNSLNDSLKKELGQKEKEIDHLNHQVSCNERNLKASKKEVEELKEQVSTLIKEKRDMEVKMHKASERLALVDFELELHKIELKSSQKIEEDLLDELCSCNEKCRDTEIELQKLQTQLSCVKSELQYTKIELENSTTRIQELEVELSKCRKISQEHESESRRVQQQYSSIIIELKAVKSQQQYTEAELRNMYNHMCSLNDELMFTNQKLDQLLMSNLWFKVDNCHNYFQQSSSTVQDIEHSSLSTHDYDFSS